MRGPQKGGGEGSPLTPATDAYNPRALNRHGTARKSPKRGIPIRGYPMPGWDKKTQREISPGLYLWLPGAYRVIKSYVILKVKIYFACISLIKWALGPELGKKWLSGIF